MKITIQQKFNLSNPIEYATFRYYEDISKLIAEGNQYEDTLIATEPFPIMSGHYKLKEIKWDSKFYNFGKIECVFLTIIYEID